MYTPAPVQVSFLAKFFVAWIIIIFPSCSTGLPIWISLSQDSLPHWLQFLIRICSSPAVYQNPSTWPGIALIIGFGVSLLILALVWFIQKGPQHIAMAWRYLKETFQLYGSLRLR